MSRAALIAALTCLIGGTAQAQVLRSDSPLWTYEQERDPELFPQAFFDEDSFGCSIPFRTGLYRRVAADEARDESFVRIDNYGVFHCALIYGAADDFEEAESAFEDHAWLITLGDAPRSDGSKDELLALQIGIRAGSRYVLFRRRKSDLSAALEELDWKCPASAEHRTAQIDIWIQDSCVISSKNDLRRIARAGARRSALATLEPMQRNAAVSSEPSQR